MFRRIYVFLLTILLIFATTNLPAQQDYEVAVTYVSVWVKAVDDNGNPVQALTQDDFAVYEDGKPVQITCFDEVKIAEQSAATQQQAEVPVAAERFVIYLDLLNTTPREYQAIKPGLKQFLTDVSKRNAEVMLAGLMPTQKLGIIAPFTKDFPRLSSLIDQAPANSGRDTIYDTRRRELEQILEGGHR